LQLPLQPPDEGLIELLIVGDECVVKQICGHKNELRNALDHKARHDGTGTRRCKVKACLSYRPPYSDRCRQREDGFGENRKETPF
jgi:hypothetical protein